MKKLIDVIVAVGLLAGVAAHAEDVAQFDTVKATQIELGGVKTNAWPAGGVGVAQDLQGVLNEGNTATGVPMRLTNGTFSAALADPAAAGYFSDNDYFGLTLMRRGGNGNDDNAFWLTQVNGPAITFGIDGVYDVMLCKDNVGDITDGAGIFKNGDGDEVRLGVGMGGYGVDRYGVYAIGGPWTAGFFTDGGMYDATLVNSDGEGDDFAAKFVASMIGATVTVCNLSYALEVGAGDTLLQRALTTHNATDGDEIVNYQTLAGYVSSNALVPTIEGPGAGQLLFHDGAVWRNSGTSPMGNGDMYYWNGSVVSIISANWDNGDILVFTNGGWTDLALGPYVASHGDNLGNHAATQDLDMASHNITGVQLVGEYLSGPNPWIDLYTGDGGAGLWYGTDRSLAWYGTQAEMFGVWTLTNVADAVNEVVNYQALTNYVGANVPGLSEVVAAGNSAGGDIDLIGSSLLSSGDARISVDNSALMGGGNTYLNWSGRVLTNGVWTMPYEATAGAELVNYQTMTNYVTPLLAGIVSGGSFQIGWNGPTSTVYVVSADGSITNKVGTFYGL